MISTQKITFLEPNFIIHTSMCSYNQSDMNHDSTLYPHQTITVASLLLLNITHGCFE